MGQVCFITPYFCRLYDDNKNLLNELKISTSLWTETTCGRKISIIPKE
jgi:hypothetical protein